MRGKKAKMIRKLAYQMTEGQDLRKYVDRAENPHKPTRRTRRLYDCTRQVYQSLKTKYKNRKRAA